MVHHAHIILIDQLIPRSDTFQPHGIGTSWYHYGSNWTFPQEPATAARRAIPLSALQEHPFSLCHARWNLRQAVNLK